MVSLTMLVALQHMSMTYVLLRDAAAENALFSVRHLDIPSNQTHFCHVYLWLNAIQTQL